MRVFIGWDQNEVEAYKVACASLRAYTDNRDLEITPVGMDLVDRYDRETYRLDDNGELHDVISHARMTTSHAIARFFIPHITNEKGWVLFCDGDVLFRKDVRGLFALADDRYAVMVVKHNYQPKGPYKKNDMQQTSYPRKNWSSVMLMNLAHPQFKELTVDVLNTVTGRALHNFDWLEDRYIGELPDTWNWLVGHSTSKDPALVHFTEGLPSIPKHREDPYAEEWRSYMLCRLLGLQQPTML